MGWQIALALGLSLVVGLVGYWRGSLSRSGVLGAVLVGTATFGVGGWQWGVLIVLFFVSSTALSHFREADKQELAEEKFAKGHQRDLWQALANGGVPALLALTTAVFFSPYYLFVAFVGAVATVTADTWATELGTLSPHKPRLLTTREQVEPGTSGGVTWWGTAVSLAGGFFIGGAAGLLIGYIPFGLLFMAGGLSGLVGSLCDSYLGATVQVMYYSEGLQKETERRVDKLGQPTHYLRGWRWLNNDLVNAVSSLVGALTAVVLFWLWLQL